jgi:VCBS repeat protein
MLGLLFFTAGPSYAQLDFAARRDLPTGSGPRGVRVADLNSDGKKDIVVASSSADALSILLGAGSGVFKPEVRKATSPGPIDLVIASLNSSSDALLDVAVACYASDMIQFFPGNGAGGFGSPVGFSTGFGSAPIAIDVVDYNLDGKKDLVVLLAGAAEVRLYSGNGLGAFSLVSTTPVGFSPTAMVLGDWDGDGRTDFAVASEGDTTSEPPPNGTITVAYGCPTGFCFPTSKTVDPQPEGIAAGLFNNDLFPDLAVTSFYTNNVSILNGDPDFGFGTPIPIAAGAPSKAIGVGDLNGDTKQDLAVGIEPQGGPMVKIFTGNGFGVFTAGGTFSTGGSVSGMAIQDFAGTTALDIVTANEGSSSVSLLVGNGAAGFSSTPGYSFTSAIPYELSGIDAADMNADGKIDLAVSQLDLNLVNVLFGSGTGTFSAGPMLNLPGNTEGEDQSTALLIRNFTPDSLPDIASLNAGSEKVSVFPRTGAGTFGTRVDYTLGNSCNASSGANCIAPQNFVEAPLNDTDATHPDLVVVNRDGDTAFPYGSISVFLQSGSGFSPATRYTGGANPICVGGFSSGSACTSNLDCRGRCSIATSTPCSVDTDCPTPQTCSNPGPGSCEFGPAGVAAGFVDANTNVDLMVCEGAINKASFLPGTGTGNFSTVGVITSTAAAPQQPMLKDLDGDGDQDLIILNGLDSTISTFLGNNTGTFTPLVQIPGGSTPTRGILADFNLDGWDDLATNAMTGGSVAILPGDGTGHFGVPIRIGTAAAPWALATGDFNGDGKPDLAVPSSQGGVVSILLNTSQVPTLTITQVAGGTQVSWPPFFEATSYDVIRGDRALITQGATQILLGSVVCVENDSPNTDTIGNEDNVTPPLNGVFFYLFRTQDTQVKGSYGVSTSGKVRVATSGDCL